MASDMGTYLGNALCLWLAGTTMPAAPANCFAALFVGNPKAGGTEVTTTIRAAGRVAIDFDAIVSGTDNVLTNNTDTDFGVADAAQTGVNYVAIYDAATAGNLLFGKLLAGGPFDIAAGAPVKFTAGDLTFTMGSAT